MSEHPVEVVCSRLGDLRPKAGGGYTAKCPAHEDHHDSLSLDEGDDGRALLKCFAGCDVKAIVNALGLTEADLFVHRNGGGGGEYYSPSNRSNTRTPGQKHKKVKENTTVPETRTSGVFDSNGSNTPATGLTIEQYADAKHIPLKALLDYGISNLRINGTPAVRIPYRDRQGQEVSVRFRLALNGDDKFRWRKQSKPFLYGLWRLKGASAIVLAEGESDCHTLWSCGIEAIGLPGAASWNEDRDAPELANYERIYVVLEPDNGGQAVQQWLARSAIRHRAWLVELAPFKDPSALYLDDPEHFMDRWQSALAKAVSWTAQAEVARQQDSHTWYTEAKPLLEATDLLERIGQTMQQMGYAGDVNPPLLGYVALTSRLLERPMNLSYVAPSAAGKNRAIDAAKALMPEEAYHEIDAGSDRALIYTDKDYAHRVVIFGEADSIPDEGAAASAVRNLAAKNYLAYDVVEKDPRSGKHQTRHIVKPGPTGLVTTSTKSLAYQLDTRVLEVPIPDNAEQTREVLKSQAKRAAGTAPQVPDLAPYLALQRYLALQGQPQVIVPYAETLAEEVPAQAVRMRRDFQQLLTCIEAIALLYQCQRQRKPNGAIIASLDDYARARRILAPIFDTIMAEGVTPAIRSLIAAVKPEEEVTMAQLALRLTLAKSTVSYHVRRAIDGGWLVNHEMRKGHGARLTLGAPLPEQATALPDPTRVCEVFECSNGLTEPFDSLEQPLSHADTSKKAEVFECSSHIGGEGTPPPPCSTCGTSTWQNIPGGDQVCLTCSRRGV